MQDRVILHCDLNNFYASVESLYHPELQGLAIAVCGNPEERKGIVLAKNTIAKGYGVKTGETIWEARKKCPDLHIVKPHHSMYLRFSREARDIYRRYTDKIEPFGIDECWLDITHLMRDYSVEERYRRGEGIAYDIKETIKQELGITASVGVSFNKIFAKLGSDLKKPDAVTVIRTDNFKEKIFELDVRDLLYVGKSTYKKLEKIGIVTIGNLAECDRRILDKILGKWGGMLWEYANGLDDSEVTLVDDESEAKGIGNSITFPKDLESIDEIKCAFFTLAESVGRRLRDKNLRGKTVQISIKDSNLSTIERQETHPRYLYSTDLIAKKALDIFHKNWKLERDGAIRALGIRVTNFEEGNEGMQLDLAHEAEREVKNDRIEECIDKIRDRYGYYKIQRGILLNNEELQGDLSEEHIIHPEGFKRK